MPAPLPPFALERWFVEFEFAPGIVNACPSGGPTLTVDEVLALEPGSRERFLQMPLDYIESQGIPALRAAVAAHYDGLSADDVLITIGASEAILLTLWTLVGPGDAVVLPDPFYGSYAALIEANGGEVRALELRADEGFALSEARLDALLEDGRVRLVVLNPFHNPTGQVMPPGALERVAKRARAAGARVLTDDVFRQAAFAQVPPSACEIAHDGLAVGDLSKPIGLGGLRVGWVATRDRDLLQALSELRDYTSLSGSGTSEFLAALAVRHLTDLLVPRVALARVNAGRLLDAASRHPDLLALTPVQGGYSAFLHLLPGEALDTRAFCRDLAERRGQLLMPGEAFGPRHAGWVRIGLGRQPEAFSTTLDVLIEELSVRRRDSR